VVRPRENEGTIKLVKTLEKPQRLGARGILRAWKAVSLPVLEAEAHLDDTKTRLNKKVAKHVAKICTTRISSPTEESDELSERTTSSLLATASGDKRTRQQDQAV
jgi:hypothetical protein